MMKTPDELNAEMNARLERREEQAETIDFEKETEPKEHESLLHRIEHVFQHEDETE